MENRKNCILGGKASLGIELGSTRIKAVLIDEDHNLLASGSSEWENRYENGNWTYSLSDVHEKLRVCYADLRRDVKDRYGVELEKLGAIGVSAMMHGYLAFDENWNLLVPFRTWRNTNTAQAAEELTQLLGYNIPQRWSIAHFYQAILNGEAHLPSVCHLTTLAGYVHRLLTGENVLGVGDASGMFPVDTETKTYNASMLSRFNTLAAQKGFRADVEEMLPKVLCAGQAAGSLTPEGAKFLDASGTLQPGTPLCPPEGDAGTGMVATNSIEKRTGNVSAGTSAFAMIVLEAELKKVHREIDLVTTPDGNLVAMVHCNNCTGDINAWVGIFKEFADSLGFEVSKGDLFQMLFNKAMEGENDCGGLLNYNYLSGEHIVNVEKGRPMFLRTENSRFTLANFMRAQLYSALCALKKGIDILHGEENVAIDRLFGHGGFFKTANVGQQVAASIFRCPVSVMETADQGGAWGIAILAAYMNAKEEMSLPEYLNNRVFRDQAVSTVLPENKDADGFDEFYRFYTAGLSAVYAAAEYL